jgi:hypothetical protein
LCQQKKASLKIAVVSLYPSITYQKKIPPFTPISTTQKIESSPTNNQKTRPEKSSSRKKRRMSIKKKSSAKMHEKQVGPKSGLRLEDMDHIDLL